MDRTRASGHKHPDAPETVPTPATAPTIAGVLGNQAMGRLLRRKSGAEAGAAPPRFEDGLRGAGGGSPIPAEPRRHMETGLGVPLDGVRLHHGDRPAALSEQVNARAFTVGQDVYLGAGNHGLDTPAGYHLLAHEVVHTLQPAPGPATSSLTVGAADSPAEQEAETVATQLTARRFVAGAEEAEVPPIDAETSGANRTIRRFGKFEHRDIGNTVDETIDLGNGLVVDWGSVVSIGGDEYGTEEDLIKRAQTAAGRDEIRAVIGSESVHSPEYEGLATGNISHFSHGGTAIPTWESHHEQALFKSVYAGLDDNDIEWEGAKLTEAFGQHFLTDTFSSGHVRTPRAEIINWYQNEFGPRALGPLIDNAVAVLRQGVIEQINEQLNVTDYVLEKLINGATDAATTLAQIIIRLKDSWKAFLSGLIGFDIGGAGGKTGIGIAGAISGALHDQDNDRSLWVASEAHPEPWQAFGDDRMWLSPDSFEQAKLAIGVAHKDIVDARALGRTRREMRGAVIGPGPTGTVPSIVQFGLDSAAIDPVQAAALDNTAGYLVANPETVLDIVGHTCPLGADNYNDGLGLRRAQAVAAYLAQHGIAPNRLRSTSAGKRKLRQRAPKGYASNRRAELDYLSSGLEMSDREWIEQTISERYPGPPYPTVQRFVPYEVTGLNDPQPPWKWGEMSEEMVNFLDIWMRSNIAEYRPMIEGSEYLGERWFSVPDLAWPPIQEVTIRPREIVKKLINDLSAAPTKMIGDLVGMPARASSPPARPAAVPANFPAP